jgi:hypothetical protein
MNNVLVFIFDSNVLELKATIDFDTEATQYPLTIRVSDGTNYIDVIGVVDVTSVNDNLPAFASASDYAQ